MFGVLVFTVIFIPMCFGIYYVSTRFWAKASQEDEEILINDKIKEAEAVEKIYQKAKEVNSKLVSKQKKKIKEVKNI